MTRLREFRRSRVQDWFGTDLRTLALFRFLLGSITACDLLRRLADVRAFYTDFGVMPRAWLAQTGESWRLSLHLANGETGFQTLVILIQTVLALMVVAGYRTRAAAVLSFVLLGSLHSRNPLILTGGDSLLMGLWFWTLFLPVHARWSVDAALSTRPPPERNLHLSWASAGLTLQVLAAYGFSAEPFLWLAPLLALSPVFTRPLRFLAMIGLMLAHVVTQGGTDPGYAPWANLASLTVLLGGWWWDWAARRADRGHALKIYYDQDCGFCLKSCVLLRHLLALPRTELLPAQGSARASALMQAQYTWVVIDGDDVAHTRWNAWVALLRHSLLFGWTWRLAKWRLWEAPGNFVYDRVARHRAALGRLTAPLLAERAVQFETGKGAQGVAALFVLVILSWNLASIRVLPAAAGSLEAPLIRLLRLDPVRDVFAPDPVHGSGWFVVPAKLEDGTEVDVLRPGEPLSYQPRPAPARQTTPTRWRAYGDRIWTEAFAVHRLQYAQYLCRDWNRRADPRRRAQSLKLVYMIEQPPLPGSAAAVEQRVLWRQDCAQPE